MPPLTLQGDTLGEKHRHFNKLVEDAVADKHYELCNFTADDSDIDNLLKIDIACKTRNVDYIIEVMKSNDMLYAVTAIKKSTWLITEQQYANIINPEYLHTQLLPSMNTKTFNKLMLHIRLNLKEETRVETFYAYMKESDSAYKWLEHCSIPFIENVIKNERLIPLSLFKRLCRRSTHFLAYYTRVEHSINVVKNEILFLLKSHTADVLNILEDPRHDYFPKIGKKKTDLLMKTCPQRVLHNFDKYADTIDLAVVAKYLNQEEIKTFFYKHARRLGPRLCDFDTLRNFIKSMPKEERFDFTKNTFIDKTEMSLIFSDEEIRIIEDNVNPYQWFEFASFDVALLELQKLILSENTSSERCAMLSVLINCSNRNLQLIKTLLKFFNDNMFNETFEFKLHFVNNLLTQISAHELDVESWNILDQLFHSMEVYTESENNVQTCFQSIVVFKVLHDEPVPEIVEQKMTFHTFEKIQRKLNQEKIRKMFAYLLNSVFAKLQTKNISSETDLAENIVILKNTLTLLKDWKKDINKYPFVLEKIRELIKIKQDNMWEIDMSCLYNVKKSWRKHMFEESLSLCLSEEACLNALKHKPQLLTRHDKQIDTLRTDDAVSLPRLLAKLRVYWPHSLAQHWADAYLLNLNKPTGQKAVIKGLFMLLPQNQVINKAKEYAPNDFKINWEEADKIKINITINIAKHLHIVRPLIPLDTVLCYAKGDYLKYAMPSLIAILSKLSEVESRKNNCVRKLGYYLGFVKLKPDELKSFISGIRNSTTNSIIRTIIFRHTVGYLCKVKNTSIEKDIWRVLIQYFVHLCPRDCREIYQCLATVENVPISIRAEFYMKSYELLTSMPESVKGDGHDWCVIRLESSARYNPTLVDFFDDDFVINKLLSPTGTKFRNHEFTDIFASYVLWGKTDEDQIQRFRRLVNPIIEPAFTPLHKNEDHYAVIAQFCQFIRYLIDNYKDFTLSRRTTPAKLFIEIKIRMDKNLQMLENYLLYTSWRLVTEYAKLMEQHFYKMGDTWLTGKKENIWNEIHVAMFPELGSIIVKCLKEDTEKYFPSICLLFTDAFFEFNCVFHHDYEFKLEILKHMLNEPDFTPSYIVVSRATADGLTNIDKDPLKKIVTEIRNKIQSHSSQEVQLHYSNDFKDFPIDKFD